MLETRDAGVGVTLVGAVIAGDAESGRQVTFVYALRGGATDSYGEAEALSEVAIEAIPAAAVDPSLYTVSVAMLGDGDVMDIMLTYDRKQIASADWTELRRQVDAANWVPFFRQAYSYEWLDRDNWRGLWGPHGETDGFPSQKKFPQSMQRK
jgi:hypothetical protein